MARRDDPETAKLLDQFVCVRVIQVWGLDLAVFQFDWDLTWAALFLNADGTVYGRYGTRRSHDHADRDITPAGFRKAAEGALELHAAWPANRKELSGKRGPKPRWPTPESMPALKGRPHIKPATGEHAGCVHCHQAHEGELWSLRGARLPLPDSLLWTFPSPEDFGLTLDPSERATVKSIASPAKEAGLKVGDRILRLDAQPILSIADVQWVLHHAEEGDAIEAEVERRGQPVTIKLAMENGWRRKGDFTWRSIVWSLRHRLAGTGPLDPLPKPGPESGMKETGMALRIRKLPPDWVRDRNLSAASELRDGDVIVEVDGRRDLFREADFLAYLLQKKAPGSVVSLTVERSGKTIQTKVSLP